MRKRIYDIHQAGFTDDMKKVLMICKVYAFFYLPIIFCPYIYLFSGILKNADKLKEINNRL
jgi:hypothetical protein